MDENPVGFNPVEKDDSEPIVIISSSTSANSKFANQQQNHSPNEALKDLISLEKIVEIEEPQSRPMSKSRPSTRPPQQRSQATFRTSSFKNRDLSSGSDEEEMEKDEKKPNQILITELDQDVYDNDSPFDSDVDDIITPKKKIVEYQYYENDIENEKNYDTDLEEEIVEPEDEHKPKYIYNRMCQHLKVTPCSYFLAHIDKQKLAMKYHQFSDDEIRAISKPLWNNINVEKLNLDGNWIECNGAKYLSRMIRQNDFITELTLADNRLGETAQGAHEVCRMISENCILKKLNLSGNCFSDRDVEPLTVALEKNRLLKELDISHNRFGDDGGKYLGQYISSNDTLESLDISWNNFRNKAAKEIALGIKENIRLKKCNVSFNGFDLDGGKMLADVIKNNTALEHFDMSNTRLNAECAASIANALGNNETLKSLNVSNNPITTSGALAIIYAIKLNNNSAIQYLDLSEIPVTKEFENILKEIQQSRPDFLCKYGTVISANNTKNINYETGSKVDFEKIISGLKK